jgi:hypothetical protein
MTDNDFGCQLRENCDSHLNNEEYQETVVFEPDQVLPVYCIAFR